MYLQRREKYGSGANESNSRYLITWRHGFALSAHSPDDSIESECIYFARKGVAFDQKFIKILIKIYICRRIIRSVGGVLSQVVRIV